MSLYHLALIVVFVVLLVAAVFLFAPIVRLSRLANPPATRRPVGPSGPIDRSDERYWYGGFFYFNPDDPAVLVPKRFGLGFTVNLGHPLGKVFIVIMALMLLLPIALAIFVPGLPATGCHPSGCHY